MQTQETEDQLRDKIETLKVKASRSKRLLGAFAVLMFVTAAVGIVLICLPASGCYQDDSCKPVISDAQDEVCQKNTNASNCRFAVHDACKAIVPYAPVIKRSFYIKDPGAQENIRDEYHVRCVDTVARNKFKVIPKQDPEKCIKLLQVWMCFFYPKFWFAGCFASALVGLALGGLINSIFVVLNKTGSCPMCSLILGVLVLVMTVLLLFGIVTFQDALAGCFSPPTTWIGGLVIGVLLSICSFGEAAAGNYVERTEFQLTNARRKLRGKPPRDKHQYDFCGRKRYECEPGDKKTMKPPQVTDEVTGTGVTSQTERQGKSDFGHMPTKDENQGQSGMQHVSKTGELKGNKMVKNKTD